MKIYMNASKVDSVKYEDLKEKTFYHMAETADHVYGGESELFFTYKTQNGMRGYQIQDYIGSNDDGRKDLHEEGIYYPLSPRLLIRCKDTTYYKYVMDKEMGEDCIRYWCKESFVNFIQYGRKDSMYIPVMNIISFDFQNAEAVRGEFYQKHWPSLYNL